MDNRRMSCSFWLQLVAILFLLHHTAAQNKTDIPHHVTLSPFWGWISAAECLIKYHRNSACIGEQVLTLSGVINVTQSEAEDYCKAGGCGEQTKNVLDCIHSVKRDFHFVNKAKVKFVNDTITNGCQIPGSSVITTANYTSSSAMKLYASSNWILFLSMVGSVILLLTTNI